MEDKFQLRASLGSKLPKFGTSKPVGSFLQRPQNGTCNGLPAKGNFSVEKHIEHDRTPAFTVNWSKSRYPQNEQISRAPPNLTIEKTSSQVMVQNNARRLGLAKPGKQSNMLVSHKEDLGDSVLSSSTKFTKGTQFGRTSYPGATVHKPLSNGFYTSKPPTGLYRPRANSATSRNFTNNVFSSDNKPFAHVRRSQSFSHSIQNSKFPSAGLTRSYSLHRETDMTRILQSQHLPTRTDLNSRTAKQYGLPNGNEPHMKSMFTRTYSTGLTSSLKKPVLINGPVVASAPLAYKLTRPSLQKASRPLDPREIIPDGSKGSSVTPATNKTTFLSNGTCQASDERPQGGDGDLDIDNLSCNHLELKDFRDGYFSEDVDELSISSLSSSDKNDFSEDFSDDFLDLEDVTKTIIVEKPEKTFTNKPSEHLLAEPRDGRRNDSNNPDEWLEMNMSDLEDGNKVLSDEKLDKISPEEPLYPLGKLQARNQRNSNNSDDWLDMNLSVQNEDDPKCPCYVENGVSPDMDYRDPSSLELSPSDSSGGTYMWDEEGMEPIGNVHRCESYESSEMNSLDILNNIETCDLEEDDLMLDVEIPEDPPCDPGEGENMSRFERSERNLRQQKLFWKRNPPRLNGQEQYHLSNPEHYHNGRGSSCLESPSDEKDGYGSPYCSPLSPRSPQAIGLHALQENTVMLDEMTLRHMVQDCTTVKTQLLKLKRLLQQGDDPESLLQDLQLCIPTTVEQTEAETHRKTEDLLTEIQQLKEESRQKDEMIKQLQEQLKTRCKCQKETEEPKVEKLKQHDKFTQTNWRRSSPQILQCSSSALSSTDHPSGTLAACQPTGVPNEAAEQIQHLPYHQSGDCGATSIIPANELSDLLSTQLKINDGEDNPKKKPNKSHAQFDENKNVRPYSADAVPQSSSSQQKEIKSKTSVNALLTGQILSPKTLQSPKPKLQNTLAHRGNTLASPNSSSTDSKMLNSSSPSLQQENLVTKKKLTIPNTYAVHQTTLHGSPDYNTSKSEKICSPAGQSQLTKAMPDTRHSIQGTLPSTERLSNEGELSTHLRAPGAEPSKPVSKLIPKGSLGSLRPPSNLPSKLKTPNISKPDALSPEPQKPPGKAPPSVIPRPFTPKKDGVREADNCSIPKRQSRLPQPKSH